MWTTEHSKCYFVACTVTKYFLAFFLKWTVWIKKNCCSYQRGNGKEVGTIEGAVELAVILLSWQINRVWG